MENEISKEMQKKHFLYPPGGILVWVIILVELITFLAALTVFLIERNGNIEAFNASQSLMDREIGMLNTLFLLSGGYFMALSLFRLKEGKQEKSFRYILLAMGMGILFLGGKGFEYWEKISKGLTLHYDTFFSYYWLVTGFHFLHVLAAIVLLLFMAVNIRKGVYNKDDYEDVAASAAFWHMCDLIWLLVFPVLYLVR